MKKLIFSTLAIIGCLIANCQINSKAELTLTQFIAKVKANANPQILDARTSEEFSQNHLKGAINIDLKDDHHQAILDSLDKTKPVFVYSIGNGRSSQLAKQLHENKFAEVYELPGGIANWVGSGNPIISNAKNGLSISPENFKQIANSEQLVLVDFGSKYCGACRRLTPTLDSLETAKINKLKIVRLETLSSPDLIKQLGINVWPTLVLFKNGEEVWKNTGYISYKVLGQLINSKGQLVAL